MNNTAACIRQESFLPIANPTAQYAYCSAQLHTHFSFSEDFSNDDEDDLLIPDDEINDEDDEINDEDDDEDDDDDECDDDPNRAAAAVGRKPLPPEVPLTA